ncbi:Bacterial type II/III secretion system short domain protein [Bremerella volcania]|uniref:Bacterial type II/III secretion system short domain protein n=1 Tax=Bremerella volcania TaxID=2527984 RepID=A0A518CAC4_9BACT|nr:secretin N-terminal domain-containing protein [Bremerella volcania]QDU76169.1 Bacterial type II/III secretion system short domain protein [Bremerella volcania]
MRTMLCWLNHPYRALAFAFSLAVLTASFHFANLNAADPTFVGSLAIALEDEAASELQLSDEVRMKLKTLAYEREKQALDLALELKGATPEEKQAKLDAYVAESEKQAMALLTPEQQEKLKKLKVKQAGLTSILEPAIAGQLNLADWQAEELSRRLEATLKPDAGPRELGEFERFANRLLSPSQRAKWEELAGISNNPETIPADQVVPPNREEMAASPVAAGGPAGSQPSATSPSDADGTPRDNTMKFSFRYQPWGDVLDWFAEQSDLSLVMDSPPPGTFNYTDGKPYTPSEAIDLLNSILLTKGYTLVRREKMLIVVNLEDGIPPNLVTTVSMDELDNRGEYELVSCLFDLKKMTAEEAEAEITKLIGPQGAVVALTHSQQVFVTETAGRLRTIRDMIQAVENPFGSDVTVVETKNLMAEEILAVVRQLMGMEAGSNTASDGSIRLATDTLGTKIFLTGKKDAVEKVQKLITQVDVPGGGLGSSPADQLQLEVYPLGTLDPTTTLQVMQTLLAGNPDVRLAIDENTGNLIALARGSEHSTVKATLSQMQRDSKQVEVIQLMVVDPQMAVLSINKLFGGAGEKPNPNAPVIDADPLTSQLLVRGTSEQVHQIKDLLMKMGEDPEAALAMKAERGNIRSIPLSGTAAERVLNELEMLWPTVSTSRIRVVRPSSTPAVRGYNPGTPPAESPATTGNSSGDEARNVKPMLDSEASHRQHSTFQFVAFEDDETPGLQSKQAPVITTAQAPIPSNGPSPSNFKPAPEASGANRPGEIVVMMGPNGLVIASEDQEALDKLEALIETLSSRYSSSAEYSVYYLRYVKADVAAQMLQSILTGVTPSDDGSGSLMGDIASEMLGGGGGLMGSLMGLGSSSSSTSLSGSSLSIIPDMRLNALVIQASVQDLDKIDQLLKIMDQPHSPEQVETKRTPRMIPVLFTNAQDIASIVQTVYADRIASTASGQQQRQPSPEDFIRALRGGRGGREGGGGGAQSEPEKMTIGVDTRSNSLVVSAPDPLFEEVKALVEELDQAGDDTNQTMQVVKVRSSNPETIQKALSSLTGQAITVNSTAASSGNTNGSSNNNNAAPAPNPDEMRQRMEMFQRIREQMQRSGGDGGQRGDSDRGGRGGAPTGGSGRGGFGGGGGRGGR